MAQFGKVRVEGAGPLGAKIVLVGQSPGNNEELTGLPFVGDAGQLAQEAFEAAGIPWKKVRRENVFEYRLYETDPVKIRALIDDGIDVGRLILDIRSLERLRVVVAVGNEAMYALTKQWGILSLCGRVFEDMAVPRPIVVTVHPSFVLRSRDPGWKKAFFVHIKRAAEYLEKAGRTSPRGS